jgi:Predicted periplasmic lipoprotein (DUF2279)
MSFFDRWDLVHRPGPRTRGGVRSGHALLWAVAVVTLLLMVGPAAGETPIDPALDGPGARFWLLPPGERLVLQPTAPAADATAPAAPQEPRPNWLLTSIISAGAVAGGALNALLEEPHTSYHVGDEGWFGRNTHFGGADKAAHFVDYYIVSKELAKAFVLLGHTPERARWLGAGVSALTGLVNEIGDGTNRYGFGYEDLIMDVGGALSAALINAASAEDLVGFRRGIVVFEDCCNFSNEIYTVDLHLAGAARRLGLNIGPLKYLLFSVTYGVRGYPGDPATERHERRVGFEVGLNFTQILNDLNVRRDTWWGYGLHVLFDNVRLPFTAVGFRYDLNHGRWHGPNAGN